MTSHIDGDQIVRILFPHTVKFRNLRLVNLPSYTLDRYSALLKGSRNLNPSTLVLEALKKFATRVTEKMAQITVGEPEDQLRAPFEEFISDVASASGWNVVCTGETPLPNRLGRPDYAVHRNNLLAGYVELKAPGAGAVHTRFKGHNRAQFKRFSAIPNILYTDGNEWALYRGGERVGKVVHLSGDIVTTGSKAATFADAQTLNGLLRDFLLWEPTLPTNHKGQIDLKGFARLLAPLCRMLRDEVADAISDKTSPLFLIAQDWRQLLFPDASDKQFADAYAQTATFALLLGRSEGADPLSLDSANVALGANHNLLARALQVLTDAEARFEIAASLDLLLRVISIVPPATFQSPQGPWLYFYEDFLAAYDPDLRRNAGVYYTPVEVVRTQVRLVDDLLVNRLSRPLGFSDPGVVTLDPAVGTGTYLLGVIEHALARVKAEQGKGAVPSQAVALANSLYGFELMVGPYAVSELRITRALSDHGASLSADGTHIYLTDTLESPHAEPVQTSFFLRPIAEQHAKALKVKSEVPVIVCLGNPPYDRHDAAQEDNKARTGGWVRWGDDNEGKTAILRDFLDPAIAAGHGVHVKNLYNLYVYFWRWAFWKVFEHETTSGPGVVSFISASSFLDGPAFSGMREHMRRQCEELWIIDLGGDVRGPGKSDNVFAIQTPVAITIAVRTHEAKTSEPATIHYTRIKGTRAEKLAKLDCIVSFDDAHWKICPSEWQAPFLPAEEGRYFSWPLLTNLMPWQHSGSQLKRTWPIAPDQETLERRWCTLINSSNREKLFKETRDRKIYSKCQPLQESQHIPQPIYQLSPSSPTPTIERYAYRSFDRQWVFADTRLGDYLRPVLWKIRSKHQLYFASLLTKPIGKGPALSATSAIPDLDHFSGRGAKDIIPLFRSNDRTEPNIVPGLLDYLSQCYGRHLTPTDFAAYIYGLLAQPAFTERFASELQQRDLRVPITKSPEIFEEVCTIGSRLLWIHTYGERFVPTGRVPGRVSPGKAKCIRSIPDSSESYPNEYQYDRESQTLKVGDGVFAPVTADVYDFEISGLKVVQSWLKYRMKKGAAKKSSELDHIRPERWTAGLTTELLELLWILSMTVDTYPQQEKLLISVLDSRCFEEAELPSVPDDMRKAPTTSVLTADLFPE